MATRREFLQSAAATLAVTAARPVIGWQGANDRVRMAVIGCGNRAGRVFDSFIRSGGNGVQYIAACEVNQAKLDQWMTPARQSFKLEVVGDYRKVLDRKDVDAVLVATPDFSHAKIMADAVAAGKDVYCEKPASNSIARINAMLDAYKKSDRVVQIGTHQRSWDHFADAKKFVDDGTLGKVTQVVIVQPGTYARPKEAEQPVPAGLDWDMWQMDAPKRPFKPSRLGFRAWYAYGSGLVGDWGAHHVDVAHWFMNADNKVPIRTMANGAFLTVPDADQEMVPDSFSISWLYDNFLMTFANAEAYTPNEIENWGVFFIGNRASLQINRQGWAVRSVIAPVRNKQGIPPPPTAGGVTLGAGGVQIAPGGQGGGRGGRGGGRGGGAAGGFPAGESQVYVNPRGGVEEDYPLDVHTKNFLDCVKSRQKPNAHMEIGYHSALPCLLALESLQQGKPLGWDPGARTSTAL
jgi:predicted dehydrogenase